MRKSAKRNLPNIEIGNIFNTKIKPQNRNSSLKKTNPKFDHTYKFPILKKESCKAASQLSENTEGLEQLNYFLNIPKTYSESALLKLFNDFKMLNQRAIKYYSNYRLHQLQLLTKKNQHVLLPDVDKQNCKILLLLDLDETLIHSDTKRNAQSDVKIEFISTLAGQQNQKSTIFISVRPNLQQFLQKINNSGLFEIGIFTAGSKGYAEGIIDYIDPNRKLIQHRIFRDNCIQLPQCVFAKDLRIFKNRSLQRILLVDNSPFCFANRKNGIPILSFEGNQNDKQLLQLHDYLVNLGSNSENLLRRNHQYFAQLYRG